MSNSLTSSSYDKRRKAPVLDPERRLLCVGNDVPSSKPMLASQSEWELFESPEPVVDQTVLQSLYNVDGHATDLSAKYEKKN
jgi:hypothetical protein